jgi:tight adherence protein B
LVICLSGGAVVLGWPGGVRARLGKAGARGGIPVEVVVGRLRAVAERSPRRVLVGAVGVAAALGLAGGGAVAGVVAAVYAWLLGRALIRRAAGRREAAGQVKALDELAALAADLRAGLPPIAARPLSAGAPLVSSPVSRIGRLTSSVWRLAEETGAPAAELVERIEADSRAAGRAAASAAAQAAGTQTTALMLAALPLLGIGLGAGIGADPVHVLLHTPWGAGCAIVAVLLQAGGLVWADRLAVRR